MIGRDLYSAKLYLESSVLLEKQNIVHNDNPRAPRYQTDKYHITTSARLYTLDELDSFLNHCISSVQNRAENEQARVEGSGWSIRRIDKIRFVICKQEAGVIGDYVAFPKNVRGAHQIYNPNVPGNCVIKAIAAHKYFQLHPSVLPKNVTRQFHREGDQFWQNRVKLDNLSTEITWQDLDKLEKLNDVNIFIYNLSKYKDHKYTLHIVRKGKSLNNFLPLLLLEDKHVAYIRDLTKFFACFTNHRTPFESLCPICLTFFQTKEDQKNHTEGCTANTTILYPSSENMVGFTKKHALFPMSYVGFADLEALNKINGEEDDETNILATQHAFLGKYVIIDLKNEKIISHASFEGLDCIDKLLNRMSKDWNSIFASHPKYKIDISPSDKARFDKAAECDSCNKPFSKKNKKVMHHHHSKPTNNFAGVLCNSCNLAFKEKSSFLPVYFHNLSYDLTLILKQASSSYNIDVKKKSGMRFYCGSYDKIKLIDSYNMIKGSLSNLAREHIKNNGSLRYTKECISHLPKIAQDLLLNSGKQFLPYEYLSSLDKLNETSLPPKEAFYSHLSKSHISDDEYAHALQVWNACQCNTLLDYIQIYLDLDVALLADVFLQWRNTLMNLFELDCLYFLTLPSYAIEAFYYKTQTKLESVNNPDLYHLISSNIRGGFTSVGKRHVVADNKDVNPHFKPGDKSSYLLYVDFNSLYPTTMSQFKFPKGNFKLLSSSERRKFLLQDLTKIDINGDVGYYLHIDTYPISPEVIKETDAFPLCLSQENIKLENVSEYSRSLLHKFKLKIPSKNKKLIAHHNGLHDYLISLPLLQFLLKKGVVIKNVRKIYQFEQGEYLKQFIDGNIAQRASATNPFIKNALKLINNAIYGRMLLNQLNYATETKVCQSSPSLLKSFSKPTFQKLNIVSSERTLVTYSKPNVLVDSPIYVGFSVLEYAKLLMYKFWYDVLLKEYGNRIEFVYSDTDSFIFKLETDDLSKEIKGPLAPYLDLSNFPPHHPLYDTSCKGQLGKIKIETGAEFMKEFVALKPKMYSYSTTGATRCFNTLKGVPHCDRVDITLEQYRDCMYSGKLYSVTTNRLQFVNQEMSMIANNKLALSPYEDKRFYINENTSVGYGHPLALNQNIGKNIFFSSSLINIIITYIHTNYIKQIFF